MKVFVGFGTEAGREHSFGFPGEQCPPKVLEGRRVRDDLHAILNLCSAGNLRMRFAFYFDAANSAATDRTDARIETKGRYDDSGARSRLQNRFRFCGLDGPTVDRKADHFDRIALAETGFHLQELFGISEIAFGVDVCERVLREKFARNCVEQLQRGANASDALFHDMSGQSRQATSGP